MTTEEIAEAIDELARERFELELLVLRTGMDPAEMTIQSQRDAYLSGIKHVQELKRKIAEGLSEFRVTSFTLPDFRTKLGAATDSKTPIQPTFVPDPLPPPGSKPFYGDHTD